MDDTTTEGQQAEELAKQMAQAPPTEERRQTDAPPIGKVRAYFKGFVKRYFIDAFSGMALGLFCTLIIGTIIKQIGVWINGGGSNFAGNLFFNLGAVAQTVMGAGIGVGIAHSLKCKKLTMFSAAAAGMIGANISTLFVMSGVNLWGTSETAKFALGVPGDPVGAYIAAVFSIEIANLVEGRTKVDILFVPLTSLTVGTLSAIALGIPFGMLFALFGEGINYATNIQPIPMGIVIALVMGLLLTLPTSSAAFGLMLKLNGLAAGAAVAGCAAHMIGFAVASFRENKWGGLVAQGLGTSMLQIPNLAKNARILLPAVVASVIVGPLSTAAFGLHATAAGSGMGTAGLVGTFTTFTQSLLPIAEGGAGLGWGMTLIGVLLCQFILPAAIALGVSELMRKFKWLKFGDMKIG